MGEITEAPQNTEEQNERLRNGLNLKDSIAWLKPETRKKIEDAIIKTVVDLVPLTGTPIENFSLSIGGDGYVDSDASYTPNNDGNGGRLHYSRRYLWDIGKNIEKKWLNKTAESETDLMSKTAHEMYHAREAKRFPERYERTAVHELDGNKDRAELAARIFTLQYLKTKTQTSPIKNEENRITNEVKKLQSYRLQREY